MVNFTFRNFIFKSIFCLLLVCSIGQNALGQTQTFATNLVDIDTDHVVNGSFAVDGDLNTTAELEANSGLALGIGAYDSFIEIGYDTPVAANTTTFIRIDTQDELLRVLLGGGLGNLLGDVLGVVLIGNQEFTVEARSGTTTVLSADSSDPNTFDSPRVRVVTDVSGAMYIAMTPNQSYSSIRITNTIGSLLGLGNTRTLNVRGAFYNSGALACNDPLYTSYDGDGLSLDLLQLGGAGVNNPENAIDNDPNSFSELSLGVLDVAASIEQIVYFGVLSQPTEDFKISLRVDPTLLALGVVNNITFEAYNGPTLVSSSSLSSLLNLDLLGLLQGGAVAQVPFDVAGPADRIVVRYTSLLGVNVFQRLDLYDVAITPGIPVIDAASENVEVCEGESASLVATTASAGAELRWYDSEVGGNLLATTASGETFTTAALSEDTTFYVASFLAGCTEESGRVAVEVTVNPLPESGDITVVGFDLPICLPELLTIIPTATVNGSFNYYLDANGTLPITDGLVEDGITYSINADGELEVEGLTQADGPFRVYVSLVDAVTGCENAPGDLQVVDVIFDGGPEPTIALDPVTPDNIINAAEAGTTIALTGSVGGDAEAGDPVVVTVNTFEYPTTVAADLSFTVDVAGAQLVADNDLTVDASVTATNLLTCQTTVSTTQTYTVDLDDPAIPTVDTQITNTDTPTITGTADSIDDLTVTVDGITYSEGDTNLIDNGDDTWTLQIPAANALDDGVYDVIATATDIAGNSSTDTTTDELTVDTTAPTVPTVNTQETSDTTPTVTGTADSEDAIVVILNGVTYTEGDGDLIDNNNDTWTLNVPAGNALADGTYDVAITATDTAGNTSSDITVDELVINSTLPTQPTVVPQVTSNQSPTITGTADSADDLTVTVDGVTYSEGDGNLTDNTNDTWTLVLPVVLTDGVYDVTATVTQGIQTASDPTTDELTIDTTAPAVPTVDFLTTNDTTPTITGTADSSADLVVTVDGVAYPESGADLTDNGDGTWTLNIPSALAEGTYDVEATSTDAAGNSSSDATTDELTIDTTAPTVPTVDLLTTNDNTPTITGTADSSADLVVTVDGVAYPESGAALTDNGDGTWSLDIPSALAEGTYDVVATSTDAAGNSSTDVTIDELTIDTTAPSIPTVDFLTTNDTTPTITGTADSSADLMVTVDGVAYPESGADLTDNGDGTWTLDIPTALTAGTYDVVATSTDAAGNSSSDATTDELTIDTTAPTVPTVDMLTTADTTPRITGTADSTDDLTVEVDGVTYTEGDGDLTDNGDDTWTLEVPVALAEGTYDVIATATNTLGTSSVDATTNELTIDTSICNSPSFTTTDVSGVGLLGAGVTNPENAIDGDPATFSQLALGIVSVAASVEQEVYFDTATQPTEDFKISLKVDPNLLALGVANNITFEAYNGTTLVSSSSLSTLLNLDLLGLLENGDIAAVAFDVGGAADRVVVRLSSLLGVNIAQSLDFHDIAITPSLPIIDAASEDVEVCEGESASLLATTASAGAELRWYDSEVGGNLLATTASGETFTTSALSEDTTFYVASFLAGCTEESGRVAVEVTVNPLPESGDITVVGFDLPICLPELLTIVPTATINGSFNYYLDANGTLPITDGLVEDGITYSINADGELEVEGLTQADGPFRVYVSLVDAVTGCENAPGDLQVVDVTFDGGPEPTITLDPVTPDNIINAAEAGTTIALTGSVGGDAEAGDPVVVTVNTFEYSTTVAADLSFTVDVAGAQLVADDNLTVDASVTATNLLTCQTTVATTQTYTVDLDDPAIPTVDAQITNTDTPTITGTADSIDNLTVTVDGITYSEGDTNLIDNGDDTWTLLIPAANALDDGVYNVIATATDIAGNSSTDITTDELTVDTIAPTVPTVNTQETSDTTPTVTGTADSEDAIVVTLNGVTYTEGDGDLIDNNNDTWTLNVPAGNALADGTYDVAITATDTAGNTSSDVTVDELVINSTLPTQPTVVPQVTSNQSPTITGTADSADDLTVTVDGVTYSEGDGNLTDNTDDTWTLVLPVVLTDGVYDVTATVTQGIQTATDPTTDELTIDTTAPTVPTVDLLTTNDNTPTITGTADSADDLAVMLNGVTYTEGDGNLTDNGDDTWTLNVPDVNALPDGTYDVMATATDSAGNSSSDATTDELTIDTTAPTVPTVDLLTTNDNTPTITGTADSADDLTVMLNGVTYTEDDGNLTDNGDDTWTLDVPDADALPDGTYDIMATATDAAGNSSSDATLDELTIDSTGPGIPTVNSQTTADVTPTITGTADSSESLTVSVNSVTYVEGDGNLVDNGDDTWTLTIPDGNEIEEGTYDVMAQSSDGVGNTSVDATIDELVINIGIPSGDENQVFCSTDPVTLQDIVLDQSNIVWYDQQTEGVQLDETTPLADGVTYYAALVVDGVEGNGRFGVTIMLTPPTTASIEASQANACLGTEIIYTTQSGMSNYMWTITSGGSITSGGGLDDNFVAVIWDIPGNNTVSVTYDTTLSCIVETSADLEVIAEACSDLSISKSVNLMNPAIGEQVTYLIEVTNTGETDITNIQVSEALPSGLEFDSFTAPIGNYNPLTGVWTIPSLAANSSTTLTVVATVLSTGDYRNVAEIITSTPIDSNTGNNTSEVEIDPDCLMVFNEFSPNGDGMNDLFTVRCIEKYPNNTVNVYNRVGQLVFTASGYLNTWNGDSNVANSINKSSGLPAGTYYYAIELGEGERTLTGWIYIAR